MGESLEVDLLIHSAAQLLTLAGARSAARGWESSD